MTYYAILHKPTGHYLPAWPRKRGHTHSEPQALELAAPRLFVQRGAATRALQCWLKGGWSLTYTYSGEWEVDGPEPDGTLTGRKAEDMEIVPIEVREAKRK